MPVQLSAARKEQVSARASLADKPALADLKHQSSSMTNSSSIYTSSMSSTDTVLPRASNSTQSAPSLRKRHAAEAVAVSSLIPLPAYERPPAVLSRPHCSMMEFQQQLVNRQCSASALRCIQVQSLWFDMSENKPLLMKQIQTLLQ